MHLKMHLFSKKSTYNLPPPTPSPKYQNELKWHGKTIPDEGENGNYIISSRLDSHPQSKCPIHPYYAWSVYHIANSFFNLLQVLSDTSVSLATFRSG